MTTGSPGLRINGGALAPPGFRVHESDGELDVRAVQDVLAGRLAAYRVPGFVPDEDCRAITGNFWDSPRRTPRYGEGADGVEAYLVGPSHIEKTTSEYLDEVEASRGAIQALYAGAIDPIARLRDAVSAAGAVERVRPASRGGREAAASKAVSWNNTGEFLLLPHDDLAQLRDPRQSDFEIRDVERVMAVNVYPHVAGGGGRLKLWNVDPDDDTRARLGISHSGYPYPPELLEGVPSLVLPVATGDLCLINGNLVHAVLGGGAGVTADRLLLTCFTGMLDGDLVWWT